jgi:O-methyltransferase involved in polyketide biosynthesis
VHRGALDGCLAFPEARRWKSSVGSAGEPFIFGFDPEELPAYLEARGFAALSDISTADAATDYNRLFKRREPGSALYRIAAERRPGI